MKIPSLVKSIGKRMLDVIVMQLPGSMDHQLIFGNLLGGQPGPTFHLTMRCDWHDVSGAVGEPNACAGKRNLHHVLGEVTSRMQHVLMRCGNATARGVVISAKMGRDATT